MSVVLYYINGVCFCRQVVFPSTSDIQEGGGESVTSPSRLYDSPVLPQIARLTGSTGRRYATTQYSVYLSLVSGTYVNIAQLFKHYQQSFFHKP